MTLIDVIAHYWNRYVSTKYHRNLFQPARYWFRHRTGLILFKWCGGLAFDKTDPKPTWLLVAAYHPRASITWIWTLRWHPSWRPWQGWFWRTQKRMP